MHTKVSDLMKKFYVLCFSGPNLSSFSVNFKKIEQITFLDFSNIFTGTMHVNF